jgi:hypothetical protein
MRHSDTGPTWPGDVFMAAGTMNSFLPDALETNRRGALTDQQRKGSGPSAVHRALIPPSSSSDSYEPRVTSYIVLPPRLRRGHCASVGSRWLPHSSDRSVTWAPLRQLIFLLLCWSLGVPQIDAQERDGTLAGLVTDAGHYVLPGARIDLQPQGQSAVSDQEGRFTIPNVKPGDYTVTISYVGLASLTKSVSVQAGQLTPLDAVLTVPKVQEEVIVRAERPRGEAAALTSRGRRLTSYRSCRRKLSPAFRIPKLLMPSAEDRPVRAHRLTPPAGRRRSDATARRSQSAAQRDCSQGLSR